MNRIEPHGGDPNVGQPISARSAHPPMDLVCERVSRWVPRRRSTDPIVMSQEAETRIRLPNPRYPMPSPTIIRLHCEAGFRPAHGWGEAGPDALDIALNVMAAYLPFRISDRSGALRVADGAIVSRQAAQLYEAFCEDFLLPMPPEGAVVTEAEIRDWIQAREFAADLAA